MNAVTWITLEEANAADPNHSVMTEAYQWMGTTIESILHTAKANLSSRDYEVLIEVLTQRK